MEYLVIVIAVICLCLMFWLIHEINKGYKKQELLLEAIMIMIQKNK